MSRLNAAWWRLTPGRLAPASAERSLSVASKEGPVQQWAPPKAQLESHSDISPFGSHLKLYLLYFLVQALQVGTLLNMAPRFFWADDAVRQFGPMAWWLGRNLRGGRPPLMDPDLGMSSNLAADMQYGVLDPLHWIFQRIAGLFEDFAALSWFYGSVSVLLMGAGTLWLLLHYRVRSLFAVGGAIGTASSSFFLWYGSSWWPLLWSSAWLPWLWVGLVSRRWHGALVAGLATWAILASGNPYALPFAFLILVGQLWEQRRGSSSGREMMNAHLVTKLTACAGGVIAALPGLLTTIQIAPLMGRDRPEAVIGNHGFGVPNLADVIVGGTTLMGQTNVWGGSIPLAPAMATMILALPLLALVSWRKAIRAPGVLTCLIVYVAAIVFTQFPTSTGPLRFPFRYLVIAQIMLPLLALIAVSAAPKFDRDRLRLAGLLILGQFVLSVLRAPFLFGWHLGALALSVSAFVAVGHVLRKDERKRRAAAALTAIICVALGPLLGARMMISVQRRVNDAEERQARERGDRATAGSDWAPDVGRAPFRTVYPGYQLGLTVEEYRSRTYAVDEALTVVAWNFAEDSGWHSGVLAGNGNLITGLKTGFGSLAVWHKALNKHWCRDYVGATCGDHSRLLAQVSGTSRPWIDVLSGNTVVLQASAPREISEYFEANWDRRSKSEDWVEYGRRSTLPGRVAGAHAVAVDVSDWSAQPAYAGRPMDVYRVTTKDDPGSLITRIPYWPGLAATIDGNPVPVSSVDKAILKIDLPSGLSDAKLEIFYEPIGAKISAPATVLGIGVILLSALAMAAVARCRRT